MKILVSACLLGENCKYSGDNNFCKKVTDLENDYKIPGAHPAELIPVCPEVLGGLPIPRKPCEIVLDEVKTDDGVSYTAEYKKGAAKALKIALEKNVDFAILKSRSPSCGKGYIYDGTFSHTLTKGNGIFAQLLIENGIKIFTEEEIEKLGGQDGLQN